MTDRYAVFGNPVAHSKSPVIHGLFARQTGQDMEYTRQLVEIGAFGNAARAFFDGGGLGLNITVPFKLDAYQFADSLTARARRAGAVNTLAMQSDGSVLGDNTDGSGMVRDIIANLGWQIAGRKVLILGAGGAARGVLEPVLAQCPLGLVVANRTVSKAEALARDFSDIGAIEGCGFDQLQNRSFDLVVNGTSASLAGEMPPLGGGLLAPGACCYDMMYASRPTVFLEWAQRHGALGMADGLGMLVEQAAESFLLWRGVRPGTAEVIASVRSSL